jgi:hypothetical protein
MRNARKAAIGYATYAIGRRVVRRAVKRKARSVVDRALRTPAPPVRRRKPVVGAAAAAALTAIGVVAIRRRRSSTDATLAA